MKCPRCDGDYILKEGGVLQNVFMCENSSWCSAPSVTKKSGLAMGLGVAVAGVTLITAGPAAAAVIIATMTGDGDGS